MKYPKTYHLPYSPGVNKDDNVIHSYNPGYEVVVTLKVDGENTSLLKNNCHARSEDSKYHESRTFVKQLWGNIRYNIPENLQLVVENMYAVHSIYYDELPGYILGFAVIDLNEDVFLSWDDVVNIFSGFNISTVPLLYRGFYNEEVVKSCYSRNKNLLGGEQEGFVIRPSCSFRVKDFSSNVVKYVRRNHVKTEKHWMFDSLRKNKCI